MLGVRSSRKTLQFEYLHGLETKLEKILGCDPRVHLGSIQETKPRPKNSCYWPNGWWGKYWLIKCKKCKNQRWVHKLMVWMGNVFLVCVLVRQQNIVKGIVQRILRGSILGSIIRAGKLEARQFFFLNFKGTPSQKQCKTIVSGLSELNWHCLVKVTLRRYFQWSAILSLSSICLLRFI